MEIRVIHKSVGAVKESDIESWPWLPPPSSSGSICRAGRRLALLRRGRGRAAVLDAAQITPANVTALKVAWSFSTGDASGKGALQRDFAFEDTPILAGGRLYVAPRSTR